MQAVAAENNLSETAFFVPKGEGFGLRWFTPTCEVDLCGHATLATGHLLLTRLEPKRSAVTFETRSGPLTVKRENDRLVMDFPAKPAAEMAPDAGLVAAVGGAPEKVLAADNYLMVYASAAEVRELRPRMADLVAFGPRGVIATAPGEDCDFVSRFFAPAHGFSGRSGHRLGPLHADSLLVGAPRQGRPARPADFPAGRGVVLPRRRRARQDCRPRRPLPGRRHFSLSGRAIGGGQFFSFPGRFMGGVAKSGGRVFGRVRPAVSGMVRLMGMGRLRTADGGVSDDEALLL